MAEWESCTVITVLLWQMGGRDQRVLKAHRPLPWCMDPAINNTETPPRNKQRGEVCQHLSLSSDLHMCCGVCIPTHTYTHHTNLYAHMHTHYTNLYIHKHTHRSDIPVHTRAACIYDTYLTHTHILVHAYK